MTSEDQEMTDLLHELGAVRDAELSTLHARLGAAADSAGLLDVAYRMLDTPIGTLVLAATTVGVVRVAFEQEGLDGVLRGLAERISPRILEVPRRLDDTAKQLEEYFTGRRVEFDLPLDLRLSTGFRRTVVAYLPAIGYGHTASYAAVARAVDNPRAVRAVGTACATNPLPLLLPCHRVIRSDGLTGSYAGGPEAKRRLLMMEARYESGSDS